jgi:nucleoid DNA-binding protein
VPVAGRLGYLSWCFVLVGISSIESESEEGSYLMGARFAGKDIIIEALRQQLGYSISKAERVTNAFVAILKKNLGQHKIVELEGIGKIYIIKRANAKVRCKELNLKHVGPTIITRYKKYEIHWKCVAHWEKEDE